MIVDNRSAAGIWYACHTQPSHVTDVVTFAVNNMLVQVSLGDEGLTQCAAKCDEEAGACVAYVMGETGTCNLLKSISVSSSCTQQQAAAAAAE
jgi:hypothetical protein